MFKPDTRTREYMKKWGDKQIPVAQVTGGTINPGTYPAIAVLGWIERRPQGWPVCGVQCLILRREDSVVKGALTIGFTVSPLTELYVNAFLQSMGWDGRVWPYDDDKKWPLGTDDEEQLTALMKKAGLAATLTFAPDPERGLPSIKVPVGKAHGPFPLAPFEEINSPPVHLERLRELCKDPHPFVQN